LAGTQPGARVGDGVFGIEPLLGGVEQVHAPGVGVALLHALQEVAVRRGRINAGEDRLIALEDLVVQAHANARQILRAVDRPGALRGLLDPGVNRPDAQRQAEQVAQQLHHVAIRAVHDQDDGQCEAAHPGFAHARERLGQRRYGRHGERHIHRLARAPFALARTCGSCSAGVPGAPPVQIPTGPRCPFACGRLRTEREHGMGSWESRRMRAGLRSQPVSLARAPLPNRRHPRFACPTPRRADQESGTLT
jgi:hypothetical protein